MAGEINRASAERSVSQSLSLACGLLHEAAAGREEGLPLAGLLAGDVQVCLAYVETAAEGGFLAELPANLRPLCDYLLPRLELLAAAEPARPPELELEQLPLLLDKQLRAWLHANGTLLSF